MLGGAESGDAEKAGSAVNAIERSGQKHWQQKQNGAAESGSGCVLPVT